MTRLARRLRGGAVGAGVLALSLAAAADSRVHVRINSPMPGARVQSFVHQARLDGAALVDGLSPPAFDVILAFDVSYSTRAASGGDIDGDGVVGIDPQNERVAGLFPSDVRSTDPGDTILSAEIRAAQGLLERLDPRRVRIGVLTFGGEVNPVTAMRVAPDQEDARLALPLTNDFAAVQRALAEILVLGPHGATNFSAGILLAVKELAALSGARSAPRADAKRVVLLLTDGLPTLPVGRGDRVDPGDEEAALSAARLAESAGVSVNTYAIGPEALKYPRVTTEIARVTGGTYTPVQNPDDVMVLLAGTSFANVEDVVFANLTTGDFSTDVRLTPDGSFSGYVPVQQGRNRVRIVALASDGSRGELELELEFELETAGSRERLDELERIRRQNKELELRRRSLEIETFRAQQKKSLEIKVAPKAPDAKPAETKPPESGAATALPAPLSEGGPWREGCAGPCGGLPPSRAPPRRRFAPSCRVQAGVTEISGFVFEGEDLSGPKAAADSGRPGAEPASDTPCALPRSVPLTFQKHSPNLKEVQRRQKQLPLDDYRLHSGRGGPRVGAGRPRGPRPRVMHREREKIPRRTPCM